MTTTAIIFPANNRRLWTSMIGNTVKKAPTTDIRKPSAAAPFSLARRPCGAIHTLRAAIRDEIANGIESEPFVAEYEPVANSLDLFLGKLRSLTERILASCLFLSSRSRSGVPL